MHRPRFCLGRREKREGCSLQLGPGLRRSSCERRHGAAGGASAAACSARGYLIAPPSTARRASRVSFLPYVLLFVTFCDRYNWGLISAGDSLEDLLAALHASSALLRSWTRHAMRAALRRLTSCTAASPRASASDAGAGRPTKPKVGDKCDAPTRQLQTAAAKIAELNKAVCGQGLPVVFPKLRVIVRQACQAPIPPVHSHLQQQRYCRRSKAACSRRCR